MSAGFNRREVIHEVENANPSSQPIESVDAGESAPPHALRVAPAVGFTEAGSPVTQRAVLPYRSSGGGLGAVFGEVTDPQTADDADVPLPGADEELAAVDAPARPPSPPPPPVPCLLCDACNNVLCLKDDLDCLRAPALFSQQVYTYELDILQSLFPVYSATNPSANRFDVVRVHPRVASPSLGLIRCQVGTFSGEHSWFPPYDWCFASCGACGQHLGWGFAMRKTNEQQKEEEKVMIDEKEVPTAASVEHGGPRESTNENDRPVSSSTDASSSSSSGQQGDNPAEGEVTAEEWASDEEDDEDDDDEEDEEDDDDDSAPAAFVHSDQHESLAFIGLIVTRCREREDANGAWVAENLSHGPHRLAAFDRYQIIRRRLAACLNNFSTRAAGAAAMLTSTPTTTTSANRGAAATRSVPAHLTQTRLELMHVFYALERNYELRSTVDLESLLQSAERLVVALSHALATGETLTPTDTPTTSATREGEAGDPSEGLITSTQEGGVPEHAVSPTNETTSTLAIVEREHPSEGET